MRMYDIISKKRDGGVLSEEEISFFVSGYVSGNIPDYQAAALTMALFLRGMNHEETVTLTEKMAASGDQLDLSRFGDVTVDKHSTGGVGDKTTLVVAPVAAAMALRLPNSPAGDWDIPAELWISWNPFRVFARRFPPKNSLKR